MGAYDNTYEKGWPSITQSHISPKSKINPDIANTLLAARRKRLDAIRQITSEQAASQNINEFKDFSNTATNPVSITQDEKKFTTKNEVYKIANEACTMLKNALHNTLFINSINTIITEACPIDEAIMHDEHIKQYTFEMALTIFKALNSCKNFDSLVSRNILPTGIGDLYTLAKECAIYESEYRINGNLLYNQCGLEIEKINDFIKHELGEVSLTRDFLNTYYTEISGAILYENDAIINEIKEKVTGELKQYQKNAKKMADMKEPVKDEIEKKDPLDTGKDDPSNPSDTSNTDNNTDSQNIDTSSYDTTNNTTDDPFENTDDDKNENENNNAKTSDKKNTSSTEAIQTKELPISEEFASELEDASAFARSYSHTFNAGDEKFDKIHKRYALDLINAANAGNINKITELHNDTKSALRKIEEVSKFSKGKYNAMVDKFKTLSDNIAFERNKLVKNKITVAQESRSIFDHFVLNIGKRYYEKIAIEGGTVEDIPGKKVIEESCIYYTILETFNTLRILDITSGYEQKKFNELINDIKK